MKPSGGISAADTEPAITRVAGGWIDCRGLDACVLASGRSLEDVASLIWTGGIDPDLFATPLHVIAGGAAGDGLSFIARSQAILPMVAARDPLASDLDPRSVAQTGWRVLNLLTSVAADSPELSDTVEETLARAWLDGGAGGRQTTAGIIRKALILSADHQPDVSSSTARCIASAGANPYAVVLGALAALEGLKTGGAFARIGTLLDELAPARGRMRLLTEHLRRYESIDGFGHSLHPEGDPRAAMLLEILPDAKELTASLKVAAAAEKIFGEKPSLDFALVVLERVMRFPSGSGLTLFAIGRTIGWIADAIEQYESSVKRPVI